jgi:hypothetical protein
LAVEVLTKNKKEGPTGSGHPLDNTSVNLTKFTFISLVFSFSKERKVTLLPTPLFTLKSYFSVAIFAGW